MACNGIGFRSSQRKALHTVAAAILRLNPTVQLAGKAFYLATQELTALRVKSLGKPVASLAGQRDELIAALDFLITGI
jgi:toxin CcdB